MAAPDLQTLLDFETETEAAWKRHLDGYLLPTVISDTDQELNTPRVEVTAVVVQEGSHVMQVTTGTYSGRHFFDQKKIRHTIDLIYSPAVGQPAGTLRGLVRAALSDYDGIITQLAVNNYLFLAKATLLQVDGERSVDSDEKTETIRTVVEGWYFINSGAYPA